MPGPLVPAVVDFLRHLESVGFLGAPRVVGDGPEVTFLPGEGPHPAPWPDDRLADVGRLLRDAHDAGRTYGAPEGSQWKPWWLREVGTGDDVVIGHGDAAPWNIVVGPDGSLGLYDWEYAGPTDRLTDLAYAAWLNAQLHDDDIADHQGLGDAATRARHLGWLLDGYGLPSSRRRELVDRMIEVAVHAARHEAIDGGVGATQVDDLVAVSGDGYPVMWAIAWRARSASWMLRHRSRLLAAITD